MKRLFFAAIFLFTAAAALLAQATAPSADINKALRVGTSEDLDTTSPFLAYERAATELYLLVYDSLTSFDKDLEPAPGLADSWELSADKLVWTFKLHPGVKWSDGKPFTSKDVKFTYETVAASELGLYYGFLDGIEAIETPDDLTVVIHTEGPKANLLQNPTPILPEHVWRAGVGQLETFDDPALVGTGPFRFVEWKKGQYFSVTANPDYFRGAPKVAGVIFSIFANRETLAQSLINGEIDVALNLYPDQIAQLQKSKDIDIRSYAANGFTQMTINCWDDPASKGERVLLDKRVRQAIDMAINREDLVTIAFNGGGFPATTLIPPATPFWHWEPTGEAKRGFDPAKAGALLDKAGYSRKDAAGMRLRPDGKPLSFRLVCRSENPREVKAGQMIQGYLRDVGVGIELSTVDDGALSDMITASDFDLFIWGWGGDVDPTTLLSLLTTDQIDAVNEPKYSNPEYDELVKKQYGLLDDNARQAAVFDAQKIAWEDSPLFVICYDRDIQAYRKDKVAGFVTVADGSLLYANTNVNYLKASRIGTQGAGGTAGMIVALVVAAAAVVVLVIVLAKRGKRGGKASWDDK